MSADAHSAVTRYRALPPRLPAPVVEQWEWQLLGSCRDEDPAVFYPPSSARGRALAAMEEQAKAVCSRCPVLQRCRDYALDAGEPYGIWGATTSKERALDGTPFEAADEPARTPAPEPSAAVTPSSEVTADENPTVRRVHRIGPPIRPYVRLLRPASTGDVARSAG